MGGENSFEIRKCNSGMERDVDVKGLSAAGT